MYEYTEVNSKGNSYLLPYYLRIPKPFYIKDLYEEVNLRFCKLAYASSTMLDHKRFDPVTTAFVENFVSFRSSQKLRYLHTLLTLPLRS